MKYKFPLKAITLLSLFLAIGCQNAPDVTDDVRKRSYGKWVIANAVKQGKPTKMLDGTKFNISELSLETNLFGSDESYKYTRSGDDLLVQCDGTQELTIDKNTADTLILSMKRKRKRYQLLMVKEELNSPSY